MLACPLGRQLHPHLGPVYAKTEQLCGVAESNWVLGFAYRVQSKEGKNRVILHFVTSRTSVPVDRAVWYHHERNVVWLQGEIYDHKEPRID